MRKCFIFVLLTLLFLPTGVFAQGSSSNYQTPGTSVYRPGVPPMNNEDRKVYQAVHDLREKAQQLIKRQDFDQALTYVSRMNALLDNNNMTSGHRNALIANIHRNELVHIYMGKGDYKKAEHAVRTAIKYNSQPSDDELLSKVQAVGQRNNGQGDGQSDSGSNTRAPKPNKYDQRAMNYIADVRQSVRQAIKAKDFKKAEDLFAKMSATLDNNNMSSYYRNQLVASIHRNEQKDIYEKQAQYQKAANAIRTAIKYDKKGNDLKDLLKTQEKVGMQRELFNLRKSHQKDLYKLEKSRQDYLNMKLKILKEADNGQGLSENDLQKLQSRLKDIDSKLQAVNQNIKATQTRYRRNFEKIWSQGVYLTQEQREVVLKDAAPRLRLKINNQRMLKQITRHLTNIAKTSEITWKDLLKNFSELSELQQRIISLRRDLEGMARGPWSRDRYGAAKKLRAALERAMEKAAELMRGIEKAFIDTKTFAKLSFKEKIKFLKLFKDVWGTEKEIQSMKPSLEDIYKKIFEGPVVIGPMPGEEPIPFDPPLPIEPQPEPDRPQPEPVEPQPGENDEVSGYGVIYQRGNYWYLKSEGGPYLTMNLPTNYMINNLEVKFSGKLYEPLTNLSDETVQRMQQIMFTSIYAPQLPDEPYQTPGTSNEPSEVIEEEIDNQDQPANLLNAF